MFSVNLCRKGRNFNSKNIIFTTDIGAFVTKPMYLPQVRGVFLCFEYFCADSSEYPFLGW